MRNEKNRATMPADIFHPVETFSLKAGVSHRQYFIHQQDLGLEVSCDGECEPYIHPAAISFHRGIDEFLDFGKRYNVVELSRDLSSAHAENCAIQKNIFTATELRMKTSTDFEQASNSPMKFNPTGGWFSDPGKNL